MDTPNHRNNTLSSSQREELEEETKQSPLQFIDDDFRKQERQLSPFIMQINDTSEVDYFE